MMAQAYRTRILTGILALSLGSAATACGQRPKVKAAKAARTSVEASITTTSAGTVSAQQAAVLGFGVGGRVSRVAVKAGNQVTQGQILAELENTDLKTVAQDAQKELKRSEELFNAGLVSRAALDEAKKNVDISRANLDKAIIRAPFPGVVTEVNLEAGELAQPTAAAKAPIRRVDLKPRTIKGDIDEVDLGKVRVGSPARVKIPAVRQKPFTAEVQRLVPFVSTAKEQDRTSQIELKLTEEHSQLIPVGASADIEVITDSRADVLAVPARTVLGHGEGRYVFRSNDGTLQKVAIKAGIGNYERLEIVSGLNAGDTVIFPPDEVELKDGMKVNLEIQPWP